MRSDSDTRRLFNASHPMPQRVYRTVLVMAACAAITVTMIVGATTGGWIGQSFPGFFVLPNRVIPSVGREAWPASGEVRMYQRTVIAVDEKPVIGNVDAYHRVAAQGPGTPVRYTLRNGAGTETVTIPSRRFSQTDYWLIFGSYLATGLLYLLVGVLAAWRLPETDLGRALLLLGGIGGIFALTGAGIYQPGADLRIHVVAEAFFPASLVYLALVVARVERRTMVAIAAIAGWLSVALAIVYQLVLAQSGAYTVVHNACETYLGVAGLAVGATLVFEWTRAGEKAGVLLRAAVLGAMLGIGVPAVIMVLSGLSGGALPVNLITATAFLFPLSIGYGLLRGHTLRIRVPVHSAAC